jgi:hypothetical protein
MPSNKGKERPDKDLEPSKLLDKIEKTSAKKTKSLDYYL